MTSERLAASGVVAAVVAQLIAHATAALLTEPSWPLALAVSTLALLLAAAATLASFRLAPLRARWITTASAVALGLASGALTGAWLPCLGAALTASAAALAVVSRLSAWLPASMDGARRAHPRLAWLWLALALGCVLQTARFGAFMQDVDLPFGSALPTTPAKHMCLPAYLHGAELSRGEPSALYDADRYHGSAASTSIEGMQRWLRDPFMYPPAALVPARAAIALSDDLAPIRTLWFALQGLFFLAVSLALSRQLSPRSAALYLWLWPALWMALPTLHNFEYGQAHLFTITLAVAGMMAFASARRGLGGALLGAAVAVKIFPGVLGLYLLLRRRWRDAFVAVAWTLAWLALAVPIVGLEAQAAFFSNHLPRLLSGEAFATFVEHVEFDTPHLSPTALVFTLKGLGVPAMSWAVARLASWTLTLVILVAAVVAARRPDGPTIWLCLLALGASRSPYAPAAYVMVGTLWLVVVLAARAHVRPRLAWSLLVLGAFLQTAPYLGYLPVLWAHPRLVAAATPVMMALVLGLSLWGLSQGAHRLKRHAA